MTSTSQHGPTLLAIDDSTLIHRLLRARLRGERFEIHCELTGEAGFEAAARILPDAILLDINLPDVDGYTVLRRLKADLRTHEIPVIILSSACETAEKVRGLEAGAIDFVTKPFEMAELIARVRSAVQIRQLIKMLAERARVDALTGLWNRAYFDERLRQEFAEAQRHGTTLSLVFCDLDHFKDINDQFGHPFGDLVLQEFASLISGGRLGDIACRYGGEEFVLILPRCSAEEAAKIADRIRLALRNVLWDAPHLPVVTASFGVTDLTRIAQLSPAAVVRSADQALYEAKTSGRDCVRIARAPEQSCSAANKAEAVR